MNANDYRIQIIKTFYIYMLHTTKPDEKLPEPDKWMLDEIVAGRPIYWYERDPKDD